MSKPKYSLTLTVRGESFEPHSVDVIEDDHLSMVLAQLPQVIRKVSEQEMEYWKKHSHIVDDDIPF